MGRIPTFLSQSADRIGGSIYMSGFCSEINSLSCPRAFIIFLRQLNDAEDDVIIAYWEKHYVEAFDTISNDLKDRLDSTLIKIFVDIENVLMNSINSPEIPISVNLTD